MPKSFVFITYAPADEEKVLPLRERLNRKGIPFHCAPAPRSENALPEESRELLLGCSHLLFYVSEECLEGWLDHLDLIHEIHPAILLLLPDPDALSFFQKLFYEEFPVFSGERYASQEALLSALTEHPFFDAFLSADASPRFGTLSYMNQKHYEGEILFCRPHGKGTMTTSPGRVEEGTYVDGLLHGLARIRDREGEIYRGWCFMDRMQGEGTLRLTHGIYEGTVCERQPHGRGRLRYFNNGIYEGEFLKGTPQGKGVFHTENDLVFQGDFSSSNPRLMPEGELSCTYPDRSVYQGGVAKGKRHGKGILRLANGDVYEGDFCEDKITGIGKYSYACGDFYHGEFLEGKRHGFGSYRSADGNVYEGCFSDDLRSGRGVFRTADGKIFSGAFSQGAPVVGALLDAEGKVLSLYYGGTSRPPETPRSNPLPRPFAILSLEDQSTYLGETENSLPHGHGKRISPEGEILEGCFENGVCNGNGRFSSPDGRSYEGDLENSKPHGYGVMHFGPGGEFSNATYRGYFQNGLPHGKGRLFFPNYGTYSCLFHEGKKKGTGEFVSQDGTFCSGEYDGDRCRGTIRRTNGDVYEGEFWLTHPSGKGRLTLKDGTVYEGSFEREQFCDERTGTGSVRFPNGDVYEGAFRNGRPEKAGVFCYANGDVYEGEFLEGKRMGKGVYTSANGNRFDGVFFEDAPSRGTLFAPDGSVLAVYENGKKQKPNGGSV